METHLHWHHCDFPNRSLSRVTKSAFSWTVSCGSFAAAPHLKIKQNACRFASWLPVVSMPPLLQNADASSLWHRHVLPKPVVVSEWLPNFRCPALSLTSRGSGFPEKSHWGEAWWKLVFAEPYRKFNSYLNAVVFEVLHLPLLALHHDSSIPWRLKWVHKPSPCRTGSTSSPTPKSHNSAAPRFARMFGDDLRWACMDHG